MAHVDRILILAGLRGIVATGALAFYLGFVSWLVVVGAWLALGVFLWGMGCVFTAIYRDRLIRARGHQPPPEPIPVDGCSWCFKPLELSQDRERGLHFACSIERGVQRRSSS